MAWDFGTDPEIAADLDRITRMVVEEIEPLDLIRTRIGVLVGGLAGIARDTLEE
jgi:hypothetical protein